MNLKQEVKYKNGIDDSHRPIIVGCLNHISWKLNGNLDMVRRFKTNKTRRLILETMAFLGDGIIKHVNPLIEIDKIWKLQHFYFYYSLVSGHYASYISPLQIVCSFGFHKFLKKTHHTPPICK